MKHRLLSRRLSIAAALMGLWAGPAAAEMLPSAEIRFGTDREYRGQFTLRYWYGSNSVDQWLQGSGIDSFSNTKVSSGILSLGTDYWFGILTPEGLGFLGTNFGIAINLDYADQLIQNVRLMTYMMDFQFARVALLRSDDWKQSLVLSAHYFSYFNTIYDNLLLTQAAPFSGAGVGLEGKTPIFDTGEASFKLVYLPIARTPTPLPDGLGLLSEINTRWFINQNLAFNVGYRFNFFHTAGAGQAVSSSTGQTIDLQRTLQDMFHGVSIGFTNYF